MSWVDKRSKKKERVLKCGWLHKKSSILNVWKPYYFLLYMDRLEYYKDEKQKKHVCDILLRDASVEEAPNKTKTTEHCFMITWRNRDTYLYIDNQYEFSDWFESIRAVLRMQYGYKVE